MADNVPVGPTDPSCFYPCDENFPLICDVDYTKAYCCNPSPSSGDNFIICKAEVGQCVAGVPGAGQYMTFPINNDQDQPMLKTALNGTTMSAWVRVAFQQYCGDQEEPGMTATTILTMGNISQPFNDEKCRAVIKAFQYGWGTINQGNRCRLTVMDQKGSEFQEWVQRMGINPEADSTPVKGKYRMKVQWGWYVTGGSDSDICGQPSQPLGNPVCSDSNPHPGTFPIIPPADGFNSAFIICSPVLYFLVDWINVHWDQGKFVYEVEGTDTLVRGQEQMIQQIFGTDDRQLYFTKAVELLGLVSFPPFRVEFKAMDAAGKIVDMVFAPATGNTECRQFIDDQFFDCLGWGPLKVFRPNTKPPLAVIQDWITSMGIFALDQTGKVTSNGSRVGITMNYDPAYKFQPVGQPDATTDDPCAKCDGARPQYGRLILWANGIPYCQGNLDDAEINQRMKAVYVVNGGNCSPVLSFAPSFRWHAWAAQKAAGASLPAVVGSAVAAVGGGLTVAALVHTDQVQGMVKTNCPIAGSTGPTRQAGTVAGSEVQKTPFPALQGQESMFHHIMTNLMIGAIEADLRVQGDPSSWLCTPIDGYARCVGIIFINPFFLEVDPNAPVKDCPQWFASDPNDPDPFNASSINKLLTNKGWYVFGADHQIKDGQYVTTLKLKLLAPGAELNAAGSVINLGGWDGATATEGTPVPYGGRFGCLERNLVGNSGTAWGNQTGTCPATWVGGGTACGANYIFVPDPDLPPD